MDSVPHQKKTHTKPKRKDAQKKSTFQVKSPPPNRRLTYPSFPFQHWPQLHDLGNPTEAKDPNPVKFVVQLISTSSTLPIIWQIFTVIYHL